MRAYEYAEEVKDPGNKPSLMCAAVDPLFSMAEATTPYFAQNLMASDTDNISWDVIFTITVAGSGNAESTSTFTALSGNPNCTGRDSEGDSIAARSCGKMDHNEPDPLPQPSAVETFGLPDRNDAGSGQCFIASAAFDS